MKYLIQQFFAFFLKPLDLDLVLGPLQESVLLLRDYMEPEKLSRSTNGINIDGS